MKVGNEALARKSLDAAQKAFLQASKLDPNDAQPLLGLAEVARLRNQRAEVENGSSRRRSSRRKARWSSAHGAAISSPSASFRRPNRRCGKRRSLRRARDQPYGSR